MRDSPFRHTEGRNGTWEVRDIVHVVIDCIPTELAAENVAREMNRAWQRGYAAAQADFREAIGARGV